ncbi:MAG: hypothetical protein ABII76_18525 [Pseudomonadota bacterium]
MPTFWVSSHALTSGIVKVEAEEPNSNNPSVLQIKGKAGRYDDYLHGEGLEWHRSESAALARADKMKTKRLASLKKQIEKLETTPIKIVEG